MNGNKPLTALQIAALRNIDLTPKTPAEIGSLPATVKSLEARGLIFVTSEGLYYVQGTQREHVQKMLEEYDQTDGE